MTMHYVVPEASKLRFGFSISNLNEVMGVFPLTSMNAVVSNSNCHTYSCQQEGPFGPLQPGKTSLYSYLTTVTVLAIIVKCGIIMFLLLPNQQLKYFQY